MAGYDRYPAIDSNSLFPSSVMTALEGSSKLRNVVLPVTTAERDALTPVWDGRMVFNTTTKRINRYNLATTSWVAVADFNDITDQIALLSSSGVGLTNRIINGNFSVNQRQATSTTTNGTKIHDLWQLATAGGTSTYSAQVPNLGDLPESAQSFARIQTTGQSAAGDVGWLEQSIESVRTLSGKNVTVSFWARSASGTPKVIPALAQSFGSGGSPSTTVDKYGSPITLSTSWQRYSVTMALDSLSGKVFGSNGDHRLIFRIWVSAGSNYSPLNSLMGIQNNTFDFWGVQVEEGTTPTAFQQKSYADELRACQRYYVRIGGPAKFATGICTSTTEFWTSVPLPVPMRAIPTIAGYNSLSAYLLGTEEKVASDIFIHTNSTTQVAHIRLTCTGLTNMRTMHVFARDTTSFLDLSAEL